MTLILLGCGKQPWEPGTLAHLEAQYSQIERNIKRNIAQVATDPKCFKDRYTVSAIQRDIAQLLEKNKQLEPYREQRPWRGIPLQGLPAGHVDYLLASEDFLAKEIDVSHCSLAPCVFNTIYNKPQDDIAGHVALWIFLKTGYSLSGIAQVPRYDVSSLPLADFYFKDDELHKLWRAMQMAPETLFNLKPMKVFYRFPHGRVDPKMQSIAAFAHSGGWIVLLDKFSHVQSIHHELGHQYDFASKYPSQQDEFLQLSGWERKSYYDNSDQLVEQWIHQADQDGYDGFVRDYAGTAPAEDFAESLAYYRSRGMTLKSKAPQKFDYFKNKIYQKRDYTADGLKQFYSRQASQLMQAQAPEWITTCLSERADGAEGQIAFQFTAQHQLELTDHNLTSDNLRCLEIKIDQGVETLERRLSYEEPEACQILGAMEENWWHDTAHEMTPTFIGALDEIKKESDILKFRQQIAKKINSLSPFDFGELIINCHQEGDSSQQCFEHHLQRYVANAAQEYITLNAAIIADEAIRLQQQHPYATSYRITSNRVKGMLQISMSSIKSQANDLAKDCSSQRQFKAHSKRRTHYSGTNNARLLESWFLDCINANYQRALQNLIEANTKKYDISNQPFKEFAQHIYQDEFLPAMGTAVDELVEQQRDAMNAMQGRIKNMALQYFNHHPDWHLNRPHNESALDTCRKLGQKIIQDIRNQQDDILVVNFWSGLPNQLCSELALQEPQRKIFGNTPLAKDLWDTFLREWKLAKSECPRGANFVEKTANFSCASLAIIPATNRAWAKVSQQPNFKHFKDEKQAMLRALILRAKSFQQKLLE